MSLATQLEENRAGLVRELRGRRWLSEPGIDTGDFELEDFTCLPEAPDLLVLTLLRFHASGKRYFVPLRATPTGGHGLALREASYDPGLLAALARCMREQRALVTHRHRSIRCKAQPALPGMSQAVPFQEGMSSNCLSELRQGTSRSVFKLYKCLGPGNTNEVRALELLAGTGLAPELLGSVSYQEGESAQALGLMTSLIEGEPIHLLLSRHIRALCARVVRAPAECGEQIRSALAALEPVCRGLGEQLLRFHQHLNRGRASTAAPPRHFQLSHYLEVHRERWERVRAAVELDSAVPQPLRARVLRQLQLLSRQLLAPERLLRLPPLPASIPHGDLHLSHLLLAPRPGDAHHLYILDVSPHSLDEQDPAFLTQTVLQDVLSLWRAIEYFSFDELMDALKAVLGTSQLEATRLVLEQPQRLPPVCLALLQVLSDWSQGLFGAIERAYSQAAHRERLPSPAPAWSRLLYACRLLRELEYNYDYGREFFKYCDFYYLLRLEGLE